MAFLMSFCQKLLSSFYAEHVPSEAQPRKGQYPDKPMVAPRHEDGYSSGEGSYMAKSIATAFSYKRSIFKHRQLQGVPSNVNENNNYTSTNYVRGNMTPASAVKTFEHSR